MEVTTWQSAYETLYKKAKELDDKVLVSFLEKTNKEVHQPRKRTLFESMLRALQSIRVSHKRSVDLATFVFKTLQSKLPNINQDELITAENIKSSFNNSELKGSVPFPANQLSTLKKLLKLFTNEKIDLSNCKKIQDIKGIGTWTYNTGTILYMLNPKDSIFSLSLLEKYPTKFPKKDIALKKGYCSIHGIENIKSVDFDIVEKWADKYGYLTPLVTQLCWQAIAPTLKETSKKKKVKKTSKRKKTKKTSKRKKRKML